MFLRKILLLLLVPVIMFAADVSFDYFTTNSDGKNVNIEWRCNSEKMVLRFELERSPDGQSYRSIATFDAHGSNQVYRFVDQDVLMKGDNNQNRAAKANYFYRIKIVGSDNSVSYSNISSVIHNVSSVRRTWGMIKEMFR